MPSLAILGAGGHGRVLADCAAAAGWDSIAFFDDGPRPDLPPPWPILGSSEDLIRQRAAFTAAIVGIGRNMARLALQGRLVDAGFDIATIVHPRAWVSPHATLGPGSLVVAGAVVNIGARLGQAVIVNTGATIDHDCVLEDGVHVSPGAHLAGGVSVGAGSWIGIGAAVREGMAIGPNVMVGAGAVVVRPVGEGLTVVGNPARPLAPR